MFALCPLQYQNGTTLMTVEWIGYLALAIGLIAIANKHMLWLRLLHGLSAATYIWYGISIEAYPLILGGSLFLLIHSYHLLKMAQRKKSVSSL